MANTTRIAGRQATPILNNPANVQETRITQIVAQQITVAIPNIIAHINGNANPGNVNLGNTNPRSANPGNANMGNANMMNTGNIRGHGANYDYNRDYNQDGTRRASKAKVRHLQVKTLNGTDQQVAGPPSIKPQIYGEKTDGKAPPPPNEDVKVEMGDYGSQMRSSTVSHGTYIRHEIEHIKDVLYNPQPKKQKLDVEANPCSGESTSGEKTMEFKKILCGGVYTMVNTSAALMASVIFASVAGGKKEDDLHDGHNGFSEKKS
ncbi:hypothetical protein L1987_03740 [Smallanthus sonchifolius]|uniref:Uncharacterized protein n=1 Tax=Smallanthus sonchifolius TaxID=185202 RepID=A0ACB9KBL4_9ASTR|nr:hypothetical protein L1987_03740 [Smallanthus sonchifolius]